MTVECSSSSQFYCRGSRRRRLIDAHHRIAACNPDRQLAWHSPSPTVMSIGATDAHDIDLSAWSCPLASPGGIAPVPFKATSNRPPHVASIRLETTSPQLDSWRPLSSVRFYLNDDLLPDQHASMTKWISAQGGVLVQNCVDDFVDIVIGNDEPPDGAETAALRSMAWMLSIQSLSAPVFVLSHGDLHNDAIRTVSLMFGDLVRNLVLLGQNHTAHTYGQVAVAILRHYEDSAAGDAMLAEKSFINDALTCSADIAADVRRLLCFRPPATLLHLIRSDAHLAALCQLAQRVSVGSARRLLRQHGDLDGALRSLHGVIEPRCISRQEARALLFHLRRRLPPGCLVSGCGPYRRRCDSIPVLPIVIAIQSDNLRCGDVEQHLEIKAVIARHTQRCDAMLAGAVWVRIRVVAWTWRHVAVLLATGSDEFVRRLRWHARSLGYFITNDDRIVRAPSIVSPTKTVDVQLDSERDVFRLLVMDFIAPRWRLAFPLRLTRSKLEPPMMRPCKNGWRRSSKRAAIFSARQCP